MVQPDGKILIGGFFGSVHGTTRNLIARLNSDGTLDTASCEASLWTTGQNLRNNPALRSQLQSRLAALTRKELASEAKMAVAQETSIAAQPGNQVLFL